MEPSTNWRLASLNGTLGLLLVALAAEMAFHLLRPGASVDILFAGVGVVTILVGLCFRARKWPMRLRAMGVVIPALFAVYLLTINAGFLPNVSIGLAVIGALLSVWFGRRAALAFVGAGAVVLLLGGYELSAARPPLNPDLVDPYLLRNWFRVALNFFTFASALAVLMHWVVERAEGSSRETELAYDALQKAQRRLENANEEERRRVARELRRDVGERLLTLKVQLTTKNRAAPGAPVAKADDSMILLDRLLGDVRRLAAALSPPLLEEAGLAAAVTAHVENHPGLAEREVALNLGVDERLPEEIEIAAFRVVDESIANVVQHADATHVSVVLRREGRFVMVQVEHDGAKATRATHLGLDDLKRRILSLGGTMDVVSAPGRGTRISASLPVDDPA